MDPTTNCLDHLHDGLLFAWKSLYAAYDVAGVEPVPPEYWLHDAPAVNVPLPIQERAYRESSSQASSSSSSSSSSNSEDDEQEDQLDQPAQIRRLETLSITLTMTLYFWDRPGSIKPQDLGSVVSWFDPDLPIIDYDGWVKRDLIKQFPSILTEDVRFTDNFLAAKAMDTVDGKLIPRLPSTQSLTIREFAQEAGSGRVHIIILRRFKKAPEEPLSEQERLEDKIERYGKYVEWLKRRYELGIRREIDNTEERPLYMSKNFEYRTGESTRQIKDAIKEAQAMSLVQERPPDADAGGAAPVTDPVADTLAGSSATNTAPVDARVARERPQSQEDAPRRSKRSRGGRRD